MGQVERCRSSGPFGKGLHVSWAEEGEVCSSKALSIPAFHIGLGLPPELPVFLLGPQPSGQDAWAETGSVRGWPASFLAPVPWERRVALGWGLWASRPRVGSWG